MKDHVGSVWRIQRVDPLTHVVRESRCYVQPTSARNRAERWQHNGWDVRIYRADNVRFVFSGSSEDD